MKVLVTGGSGYLGTHVCKYFDAINYSRGDGLNLLNEKALRESLNGVDVVIHMAGVTKGSNEDLFNNNVLSTFSLLNTISSMEKKPVFLFSSSKEVYGNNPDKFDLVFEDCPIEINKNNFYGTTKLLAEELIESYAKKCDFRAGIFRMSTVYAPHTEGTTPGLVSRFVDLVKREEEIKLKSNGEQIRDPLYISDLNDLFDKFIKSDIEFGIYNVGGGKENSISLLGLVRLIWDKIGKTKAGFILDPTDSGDQMRYITDISKLEKELNWKPSISIEEGISKVI